jgi:hypothetical protein
MRYCNTIAIEIISGLNPRQSINDLSRGKSRKIMLIVKGDQCPVIKQKMYEREAPLDLFRPQKGQLQIGGMSLLHL